MHLITPCKLMCIPGIQLSNFFLHTRALQIVDAFFLDMEVHKAYSYEIESKPVATEHMKGGSGDYGP